MARTFRNKDTVPNGWTVRDDGRPYHNGNDVWGNDLWEKDNNFRLPKYRRSYYRCEKAWARRLTNQTYRVQTRHLVRTGRWDDIIPPTKTSGWITW